MQFFQDIRRAENKVPGNGSGVLGEALLCGGEEGYETRKWCNVSGGGVVTVVMDSLRTGIKDARRAHVEVRRDVYED